jgi:SAM-dependent methyltransferase
VSAELVETVDTVLCLDDWTHPADENDRGMLGLCVGPTLDVGCGPGRLTEALGERGHVVLGIDVAHAAVGHALERGAVALRRDVFAPLPGEGRWSTALLADGNVGIGGDPVALLDRLRELLDPRGRIVVELAAPGTEPRSGWAALRVGERVTPPFPWSVVGVDAITGLAREAGWEDIAVHRFGDRWCAVLEAAS